ncbi:unnamed protein product [Cuscuta epithymum]|uniref:Uncharacterized protein n=1 Tax=Cuscuta epithymum TaxID=186058 RepID=A0AAV0DSC2_9ASTE|nr:unnamed protein product [Cuscuta epithymum]
MEEAGEVANTYFGGSLDITFQMVKDKVKKVRLSRKGNGVLGVKLASLFLVENVLLGRDRTTKISWRSIKLVNEFEEFKELWSRDAYNLLVTLLKGLLDGSRRSLSTIRLTSLEIKS